MPFAVVFLTFAVTNYKELVSIFDDGKGSGSSGNGSNGSNGFPGGSGGTSNSSVPSE